MKLLLSEVRKCKPTRFLRFAVGLFYECFSQMCFDPTLIRVLKILSRFVVCLHVKDRFFVESCTFVHFRVQECISSSEISADSLLVLQAICRPRVSWFLRTSASWFTVLVRVYIGLSSHRVCFALFSSYNLFIR